ncbi:hypothetical protein GCM10009867_24060 [Pedococcus aerophilus]|uniref:DUF3800 domain-containing protein n=1 Tax=Pedococcus aerophilus TaxID=436356 RepID=A0ABP6H7J0_9MICO
MTFFLDESPDVSQRQCSDCGAEYTLAKNFVLDESGPKAIVFSALHQHHGVLEAWIDAILGTFDGEATDQRTTFGARVGPVDGSPEPAATAVPAAAPYEDSDLWGHKLTREEALAHPLIDDFWAVVDFILENDPHVNHHVYGHLGH